MIKIKVLKSIGSIVFLLLLFSCKHSTSNSVTNQDQSEATLNIDIQSLLKVNQTVEHQAIGDLNNDGKADVVLVVNNDQEKSGDREVLVFLNKEDKLLLDASSKTVFPNKYFTADKETNTYFQENISISDNVLTIDLNGTGPVGNDLSKYKYVEGRFTLFYMESYGAGAGGSTTVYYEVLEGKVKREQTNLMLKEPKTDTETFKSDIITTHCFEDCDPLEELSEVIDRMGNKDRFLVVAPNGLVVRDSPSIYGDRIGKLEYHSAIEVMEKTDIKYTFKSEEPYEKIDGHWVKIAFDTEYEEGGFGYIFDGFLVQYTYPTIFREWENANYIYLNMGKEGIGYQLHGQCYYGFGARVTGDNQVELMWDYEADCVFDASIGNDFGLSKHPVEGKPFARYYVEDRILKVEYYYPEWVKAYSEKVNADVFVDQYKERYY